MPWSGAWQSTPVVLPTESHGQRSLVGYSPWDCKEAHTTEAIYHAHTCYTHRFLQIMKFFFFSFFFFLTSKAFCIGVYPINNVVIVSGKQWRDSAIHIHVSILPQTPLPSRLTHNTEQSSMCCHRRFLLVIHSKHSSVYMTFLKSPAIPSPPWVRFLWVSFCFASKFIYIVSFLVPHIRDAIWYFSFSVWLTSLSMPLTNNEILV